MSDFPSIGVAALYHFKYIGWKTLLSKFYRFFSIIYQCTALITFLLFRKFTDRDHHEALWIREHHAATLAMMASVSRAVPACMDRSTHSAHAFTAIHSWKIKNTIHCLEEPI